MTRIVKELWNRFKNLFNDFFGWSFCWYFLMYNHPRAMQVEYAEWNRTPSGKMMLALLSGAPLLIGMFGCLLGGYLSDRYIRRTGDRKGNGYRSDR